MVSNFERNLQVPHPVVYLLAQASPVVGETPQAPSAASHWSSDVYAYVKNWVIDHTSTDWLVHQLELHGPNLVKAFFVFIIGRWIARLVTNAIVRAARRARMDPTLLGFFNNLVYMILLTVVCISSLRKLGVEITELTAILAAGGFAIGMAMQGSLGNLASGVMLVFFKPFRVGDFVHVADTSGEVVEIQLFNTILLTLDNIRIFVPNGKITESSIQNLSAEPERRIDLIVGCGYHDDLKQVKAVLQNIVTEDPRVLQHPVPQVAVSELGDSSVNFVVRPWVRTIDYWNVRFDLTECIKLAFDEHNFTIPFPSRDVFVHPSTTSSAVDPNIVKFPDARKAA